jgi:hypothetical protein
VDLDGHGFFLFENRQQKCDEVCLSVINGAIPENW